MASDIRAAKCARRREQHVLRADWFRGRAEQRNVTPQQQLARLDFRLGQGVGAKRERARLASRLKAA
jgi:hypothetical protein